MGSVATEIRGSVAVVSFENAARMNAIDAGVAEGLAAAAAALRARNDIGALVLRGAGEKSFCSGVDLRFVEQFADRAAGFAALDEKIEVFCRDMAGMPFPTIAMLHGNCHGGGVHFAATADFRFGDSALKLSVPAVKNRLFYPISALERLVLIVGETRTKRMMYEGGPLDADTLLGWGVKISRKRAQAMLGDEERYPELLKKNPFGRPATVDEIAVAVVFLASDLSSYTSGTIVTIDGGFSKRAAV